MQKNEIIQWLKEDDPERLEDLWRRADGVRQRQVGGDVHLRGLIEISNYCERRCHYCGLRAENRTLRRYRLSREDILSCIRQAVELGYGTVVLQGGEDRHITGEEMVRLIEEVKRQSDLAVTLSLGERQREELGAWRRAGADRYLLRFETSNVALYRKIHPPLAGQRYDRFQLLETLDELGYEVGSGVMIGLPGQHYGDLAEDILMFARLDLDMIGVGPYLPHPETPLGKSALGNGSSDREQVPNTELMGYKTLALTRLVCPETNIPSTTALATLNQTEGYELGLRRGANVVMPNLTPTAYRAWYDIYPGKAGRYKTAEEYHVSLSRRIRALGRTVGTGRGDSIRYHRRNARQDDFESEVKSLC